MKATVAPIVYQGPIPLTAATEVINVQDGEDDSVSPMEIDPILASLRLGLSQSQPSSRLDETEVFLEILSGLFFFQERTKVTMSVILENGRRIVISDPTEIRVQSSNSSILSVDGNFVIAEGVGTAELNVSWVVCNMVLGSANIAVSVEFNEHRPIFETETQTADILEDSPMGTLITTVVAIDLDFANTDLSRRDTEYRFMDEASSHDRLFVLDRLTGELRLNGPLDRETRDNYVIMIEATDRAQRQAEQQIPSTSQPGGTDESGDGTGYSIGSGEMLMPDITTSAPTAAVPPLQADPADIITVS